jgi:hypothetical protein
VVFQPRGDFFFEFAGDTMPHASLKRYAKPYPPQTLDKTGRFPRVKPGGMAAAQAVVKGDTVFVLRGGIANSDEGKVDAYLIATGVRVAEFQLPKMTYTFDVLDNHVVVVEETEEGSILRLYSR